jgi:putative SOS response-associated peptidase YedK
MCFHYSLTQQAAAIAKTLQVQWNDTVWQPVPHANGFSFRAMPVLTQENLKQVQLFNWGLIPHWVKTKADADKLKAQTLNARCETIFEKPSFRNSITKKRCLIPADGFFEWMDVNGKKHPYRIRVGEDQLFFFGGIYAEWADPATGELISSFSIMTTEANALMEKIHNIKKRMPVIISPERYTEWLDARLSKDQIMDFFTPFPDEKMNAEAIEKLF